jgi:hypothetical protein
VTGSGEAVYEESWDRPHRPSADDHWQESDWLCFMDVKQKIGGTHRVGQYPNRGQASVVLNCFALDGERYIGTRAYPASEAQRWDTGQRVGSYIVEALGDMRHRYRWDEPDCSADLIFEDSFYTPRGWQTVSDSSAYKTFMDELNANGHLECSGRLRGAIRIGAREYHIDALAHRDRSWGPREWSVLAQSKMFSGTVGPELSWAALVIQRPPGDWFHSGFVMRNRVAKQVKELRAIVTLDNDGYTQLGGEGRMVLEDGERLSIPIKPVQCFTTDYGGVFAAVDGLSTVEVNGKLGFVDMGIVNNPGRGPYQHMPTQAQVSPLLCVSAGLSKSMVYDLVRPA